MNSLRTPRTSLVPLLASIPAAFAVGLCFAAVPTPAEATLTTLEVTVDRATAWRSRSKLGRVKAFGTIRATGAPTDMTTLVAVVTDGQDLDETGEVTSCRTYPSGTVRCENDDRSTRIRYIPNKADPELYRYRLDFRRRDITAPQVGPITIRFTYGGSLSAAAKNEPCQALNSKLVCKGSSSPVEDALAGIWFVDSVAAPGGDGSFAAPFDNLADAESASAPGETIFVSGSHYVTRDFALKENQKLLSPQVGLTVMVGGSPVEIVPAGGSAAVLRSRISVGFPGGVIKGFIIDGSLRADGANGLQIDFVEVRGSSAEEVEIRNSANVDIRIQDLVVRMGNFSPEALRVFGTSGSIVIEDGDIEGAPLSSFPLDCVEIVGGADDLYLELIGMELVDCASSGMDIRSLRGDAVIRNGSITYVTTNPNARTALAVSGAVSDAARILVENMIVVAASGEKAIHVVGYDADITIRDNTVSDASARLGIDVASQGGGTVCSHVVDNSLVGNTGILFAGPVGTMNSTATSLADLESSNGGATFSELAIAGGVINFGGPACALPVAPAP